MMDSAVGECRFERLRGDYLIPVGCYAQHALSAYNDLRLGRAPLGLYKSTYHQLAVPTSTGMVIDYRRVRDCR